MKEKYLLSPFFIFIKDHENTNIVNIITGKKFSLTDSYISKFLIKYRKIEIGLEEIIENINHENTSFLIAKKILIKKNSIKEEIFKTTIYNQTLFNLPHYSEHSKLVFIGIPFGRGNYTSDNPKLFPKALRDFSKTNNINLKGSDFHSIGISNRNKINNLNYLLENNLLSDGGDIFVHENETTSDIHDKITYFSKTIINNDQTPFFIGGDHSISYSILKGINAIYFESFNVLHFDAHTDIYSSEYDAIFDLNGSHHHGNFVKKALELNNLDKYYQFGIRGICNLNIPKNNKLEIVYSSTIKRGLKQIKQLEKNKKYYITFDIDVLDPSIAPATATPEPDGLSLENIYSLFDHLLSGINIIGIDIVEVNPKKDIGKITQKLSIQLILKLLSYLK